MIGCLTNFTCVHPNVCCVHFLDKLSTFGVGLNQGIACQSHPHHSAIWWWSSSQDASVHKFFEEVSSLLSVSEPRVLSSALCGCITTFCFISRSLCVNGNLLFVVPSTCLFLCYSDYFLLTFILPLFRKNRPNRHKQLIPKVNTSIICCFRSAVLNIIMQNCVAYEGDMCLDV